MVRRGRGKRGRGRPHKVRETSVRRRLERPHPGSEPVDRVQLEPPVLPHLGAEHHGRTHHEPAASRAGRRPARAPLAVAARRLGAAQRRGACGGGGAEKVSGKTPPAGRSSLGRGRTRLVDGCCCRVKVVSHKHAAKGGGGGGGGGGGAAAAAAAAIASPSAVSAARVCADGEGGSERTGEGRGDGAGRRRLRGGRGWRRPRDPVLRHGTHRGQGRECGLAPRSTARVHGLRIR